MTTPGHDPDQAAARVHARKIIGSIQNNWCLRLVVKKARCRALGCACEGTNWFKNKWCLKLVVDKQCCRALGCATVELAVHSSCSS